MTEMPSESARHSEWPGTASGVAGESAMLEEMLLSSGPCGGARTAPCGVYGRSVYRDQICA